MDHNENRSRVARPPLLAFAGLLLALGGHESVEGQNPRQVPQQEKPARGDSQSLEAPSSTNAILRLVRPGVYEIGSVRLDKALREVSFPAEMNMDDGPIEYLLVHKGGKRHESILVTEAEPLHIQSALLLLGAKSSLSGAGSPPGAATALAPAPPSPELESEGGIREPAALQLAGDSVRIELVWTEGTSSVRRDGATFFVNEKAGSARQKSGQWVYNGSRIQSGVFMAQTYGSVISLITDPDALINNRAPGYDNDDVWAVNTTNVPPVKSSVRVILRLAENGGAK